MNLTYYHVLSVTVDFMMVLDNVHTLCNSWLLA